MSTDAPAIPLFGDAYLADTRHLSLEEHGAYLQLMMIAWRLPNCALPDDDARLARMLGITGGRWAKLKPHVLSFWALGEFGWTQGRLSKERAFVEKKRATNSAAAKTRWETQVTENNEGDGCERISECNAPPPPPPQEVIKEEEDASHPLRIRAEPAPISEAIECWNRAAVTKGWRTVQRLSDGRQASVRNRLRADGVDGWRAAIARAHASPYLGGADPPPWFTFDWFIKPANFLKVIEGNYDRATQQPDTLRGSRPNPALDLVNLGQARIAAERENAGFDRGAWPALPPGQFG